MPETGVRVTVGTFNVRHGCGVAGLDLARTADTIARMDTDVVALQEVDRCWDRRSGFVDQAQVLAGRLGMNMAFGACLDRPPTTPDHRVRQYGVALLSRHPIIASHNTLLPRPRGGEQRTLLSADVRLDDVTLCCLATHLQHRSRAERTAQVAAIRATLGGDDPTVLLGDLNASPDSPEVVTLTEDLVDAWAAAGDGDGYTYATRRPHVRIDYVLASPEAEVEQARVLVSDASDHLPVTAGLRLTRRPT